ncbi:cell division/cell wall cluster transcriptional repressor MraZ [bacterium (Candidatus Gribaldobacteria) CG10_big_fil_rev_8_21_14_0_10_37_21]|uniref:Transcriptional regulator MraZ n=3 Tax=Candidatus Gribaldobacteria TaxID=2798536 RepID=A0A2H0UW64_9BACT|nr:MAG: cell division/cell wall cluster transcriptional repressor MraZ [bacterium (Candidatus Gribaldobacteria) CG10_big_fil_rev_8_21_14_0_10_37_21]
MFLGEYTYKIDDKKRMGVPPKFRQLLGKKAIITRGLDNCLFLYPMKTWETFAKKIAEMPSGQSDARGFARIMLAGAMEVSIDNLGRILMPDYLKDYAQIKREVVVAGLYNRVEIWDKAIWENYTKQTEKEVGNIAERLKEFGI